VSNDSRKHDPLNCLRQLRIRATAADGTRHELAVLPCARRSHAVAGSTAGSITVLLLHPFDVIKTRLQGPERHRAPCTARVVTPAPTPPPPGGGPPPPAPATPPPPLPRPTEAGDGWPSREGASGGEMAGPFASATWVVVWTFQTRF